MTANRFRTLLVAVCLTLAVAASASAQVFGTFNFQMQPYCNVVTMTITQIPTGFTLDGFDDQCAALKRASLVGMATLNPDGTVGVTFTIVTAPAGKGVHVSAVISPVTGSGTWTDSVANTGTFVLAGAVPGLLPRPLPTSGIGVSVITTTEIAAGAVGGTDINTAEVQARVTGTCPAGQAVNAINPNGTVTCQLVGGTVFSATRATNTTFPQGSFFAVPLTNAGALSLAFELGAAETKVLTYSAECAVGAAAGNTLTWLELDILLNGVALPPTAGTFDAFCTSNGTADSDGWARQSITLAIPAVAGVNTITIRASIQNGVAGNIGWLGDTSLVIR